MLGGPKLGQGSRFPQFGGHKQPQPRDPRHGCNASRSAHVKQAGRSDIALIYTRITIQTGVPHRDPRRYYQTCAEIHDGAGKTLPLHQRQHGKVDDISRNQHYQIFR